MKLVSLNIFGGKYYESLMKFLKEQSRDTDIFCFQEVLSYPADIITDKGFRANILSDLQHTLTSFNNYFSPVARDKFFGSVGIEFGQAIFVRKGINLTAKGREIVHPGKKEIVNSNFDLPRIVQYVQIGLKDPINLFNFHGLTVWPKTDTPERIEQSNRVRNVMDKFEGKKILCGDFNLRPETESLKILENGMKNLIKEFRIESTRPLNFEDKTSDYMIVSPEMNVKSLNVPDINVSDHLPLILEFG